MNLRKLEDLFDSLSDEELLARISSASLTDEALALARAEASKRLLVIPNSSAEFPADIEVPYEGDFVELEGNLTPQEAQVLVGFLQSAGVAATAGDTNIVQANSLLSIAVGGARIRVPAERLMESKELLAAFRRGEFALGDDFNDSVA